MNWIRSILEFVLDFLFGCRHDHLTRPFTLDEQTYMVCLDCGKRVYYSTDRMKPMKQREVREMKMAVQAARVNVIAMPSGMPPKIHASSVKPSGRSTNSAA